MKRQSLLFIAGGLMALASCTTETTTSEVSQVQVDSTVNARVEEIRLQMMASNDSLINEMALWKADSMCSVMKGKAVKPRVTTTRTTRPNTSTQKTDVPVQDPRSVDTRPGATNQGGNKSVDDRPGSSNQEGNKSVNDRPGAN